MSYRYNNAFVKPGLNTLVAPTPSYTGATLWAWGYNNIGQLGTNNTTYYSSPKQIGALTNWSLAKSSSGCRTVVAIKTNGELWGFGNNGRGQLGLNNTTYSFSSPVQTGALTNWADVSVSQVSVAVKTDGTLWTWGYNYYGGMGIGNNTYYSSPKQVGSLTTWSKATSGGYTNCFAIKTDGTLWAWGGGPANYGQLGLGDTSNRSSPTQIGALTNWLEVSCGGYCAAAVKTDGTLWTWGYGNAGRLGLGNTTNYSSPKQVGVLTNWLRVSCGYSHMMAIKTDGTLWSWGNNSSGQLGLGNATYYSSPKQIGVLTNWSKVACGNALSFSIKSTGTLWSWGYGAYGQLGIGNTNSYSSPKQVGALTNWYSITAQTYSAVAIQY